MKIDTVQLNITLGRNRQEQNKTNKNKVTDAAQGDNYNVANYRTKIPGHVSRGFQTFLYLFHVSWGGTPHDISRKPGCETLLYISAPEGHHYITNSLNMPSVNLVISGKRTYV
jgi:hypothetical protein